MKRIINLAIIASVSMYAGNASESLGDSSSESAGDKELVFKEDKTIEVITSRELPGQLVGNDEIIAIPNSTSEITSERETTLINRLKDQLATSEHYSKKRYLMLIGSGLMFAGSVIKLFALLSAKTEDARTINFYGTLMLSVGAIALFVGIYKNKFEQRGYNECCCD